MTKIPQNKNKSHKAPSPTRNEASGLERVTFHTQEGPSFTVYAESGMVQKWRSDKTIPLVDVLQSFDIFEDDHSGNNRYHPSKDTLKAAFSTADAISCIETILQKGRIDHHVPRSRAEEHFPRDRAGGKNAANSSAAMAR